MIKNDLSIEQKIEKDRVDNLYRRSRTASLALLAMSSIYLLWLVKKFPWQPLLAWYLVLIAVLFSRWLMAKRYAKDKNQSHSLAFWLYLFRFGILTAGVTIGALNVFFFTPEPLSHLLMAIIIPYGVTVGAVTMLVDFFSFCIYVMTVMTPVVYQTTFAGEQTYAGTGILTCIAVFFLFRINREYNDNFVVNTRLRYENKALLEDLEKEKNTLNSRLGRILNDSTIEVFVADAESLIFLQVNQGAVDNLGYSKEEFLEISLLDICTDLDNTSFSQLIAPLYNGRMEPVVYTGTNRRKNGTTYPIEARIQLSTVDVPPIIVANVQDISERVEWEEKLIYQANYDQLTTLYNRHYMQAYMQSVYKRARRYHKKVALLFMDLDNFKDINDTLGHDTGDEVLRQTAHRISSLLRESDTAARTGGDEFTVLLENLEEKQNSEVVARKLVNLFKEPFIVKGREIYTTISIGISIYPDDNSSIDQLMQCADMAMYQAKNDGRNNYRFFSKEMRRSSEEQMLISNHLRYALSKDELSLVFQPKIDITKGKIVGAEALLRWHNSELGNISPDVFISLAENLGLINDLGTWVLENACLEAMRWQQLTNEKLQISVNVSPQQFRAGTLLDAVEKVLKVSGLSCEYLELEITESLLMQDSEAPLDILNNLHDRGIRLALDDFGTGYSSLSYLRRFPLQVLKIDRSFINDLETDQNHKALVDAIIAMGHSLKLDIVAEGVENKEQLEFLRKRGVKIIQGYLFSPPVPAEKFRTLLKSDLSL
ncbi:MAG: putative bifunctional diguanylate cyclase/phosphodiesterase [Desulforhopalus sp.]